MDFGAWLAVGLLGLLLLFVVLTFALLAAANTYAANRTTTAYTQTPPRQQIKREALSEVKQIERVGEAALDHEFNRYVKDLVDHYYDQAATQSAPSARSRKHE